MKKARFDSERKNMNVPLTGNERVMEEGTTLVTMTDLTGKITYANTEFSHISQIPAGELLGKPHSLIRHPDMPRSAFADLWDTIQAGMPWNGIVKNRSASGDHYWVDANVAPRREEGKLVGYISVRRKPDPARVRSAEELYQKVLKGFPLPSSSRYKMSLKTKFALLFAGMLASLVVNELLDLFIPDVWWAHLITAALGLGPVCFGIYVASSVLGPLAEAVRIGQRIAEGDLRSQIAHDRNDEIGALQKSLLNMLVNVAGLVGRVKENTTVLNSASAGLTEASESLSLGSERSSRQSQSIASAAVQMNQNLQVVSSAAEEMSISIAEVARKAADAARVASEANTAAAQTDAIVKELGSNAAEIGQVIESISSIAAQTNLLALNAAIEAAGAGDAGKGFAVVAQEVKELARQSARASEDIKRKITAIQKSSELAASAIGSIAAVVKSINEINGAIAAAVEEQSITTREIASNVNQTGAASKEVTQNIEGISSSARAGAADAAAASRMAGELQTIVADLRRLVTQFAI